MEGAKELSIRMGKEMILKMITDPEENVENSSKKGSCES